MFKFFLSVCCLLATLLPTVAALSAPLPPAHPNADSRVYAGIEIGAKGVKMSVIREEHIHSPAPEIIPLMEQTSNTELVSMSQQAIIATAWAVRSFLDTLLETWQLPKNLVFVVVSSGAKIALEQAGKTDELREAIRYAIDESGRELLYVLPDQEAELMASGVLLPKEWGSAVLFDIGGGNTKGGGFNNGVFMPFSLPYGTRSVLNTVPHTDSLPLLAHRLDSLYTAKLRSEFVQAASSPALDKAQTVYVSGGIFWIMATLLYPEKATENRISLTLSDLNRFQQLLATDFETLTHPAVDPLHPQAAAIEKAVQNARSTYSRASLVGGTRLALGLAQAIDEAQGGNATFIFDRYANLSWIRGLVRQSALNGGQTQLAVL